MAGEAIPMAQGARRSRWLEVCATFLKLGLTSFGGPIAHLGYIRAECVVKRRWVDEAGYADTVALCQFLPGPASSQVVFALGMQRAGLLGAIGASLCFLMPSAAAMIAFAHGVRELGTVHGAHWVHGLKLAAVAVVAQAVFAMGTQLCPDRARITLCLLAAAITLVAPGPAAQALVIVGAAACTFFLDRTSPPAAAQAAEHRQSTGHGWATAALIGFAVLLGGLQLLASLTGDRRAAIFDAFYRAGALVFGGGHVVLPLLREALVPRGFIGDDAFLAGYGAAQAVPGPLFSFAGYLGAMVHDGPHAWLGGLWALFAIFLPGFLLVGGALPFWQALRAQHWMQAALRGANAGVVGVLLSALYRPVITESVTSAPDAAVAVVAFGLLAHWRTPPWLVVLGAATAGQWLL